MASLVVVDGSRAVPAFPVREGRTIVGRGEQECDVVLLDPLCSRVQWVIDRGLGGTVVTARGDNETWLDGELLPPGSPRPLADSATLKVGHALLQFRDT